MAQRSPCGRAFIRARCRLALSAWLAVSPLAMQAGEAPPAEARAVADRLIEAARTPAMRATAALADAEAASDRTLAGEGHGQSLKLHVALDGNDAWTGTLPAPDQAGGDGPFRTLERARDELRKRQQADALPHGAVVLVRAGRHLRTTAFTLGKRDSGSATAPIVYRAYPGERPVLSGGAPITGWTSAGGGILQVALKEEVPQGYLPRQLFWNRQRQTLARFPNRDPDGSWDGAWSYVPGEPQQMYQDQPTDSQRLLPCPTGSVHAWAHPEDGQVNIYPRFNWWNRFVRIASVDAARQTITLAGDAGFAIRPLDRFYICNLREELDAPGEWFLDPRTRTLYFWPPQPQAAASEVAIPALRSLVVLERGTAHVTIRGFGMECCDGPAVQVDGGEDCLVAGNTVTNAVGTSDGGAAISVKGGHRVAVVGNDIGESCCHGILLQGGSQETLEPALHCADNNYIHHIGRLNGHGCGVYLDGVGLRVSRNLIHDTSRCGIFGGGNDCIYEYNHLRHVNLATEDTGAIYVGGPWSRRGAIFRGNFIHDVIGFGRTGRKWLAPHFAWCIYLDDGRCEAHVHDNILVRSMNGGSYIHAGHDNLIENNILIDHTNAQMRYQGHNVQGAMDAPTVKRFIEDLTRYQHNPAYAKYRGFATLDVATADDMARNSFVRNIISYAAPKAQLYAQWNWPEQVRAGCVSDCNLIHHAGTPIHAGLPSLPAERQWEAWRAQGFDTHSELADPLFQDRARDDYRLRPDSPAHALGFRPIAVERMGPAASPLRASWPIVEVPGVRERPMQ